MRANLAIAAAPAKSIAPARYNLQPVERLVTEPAPSVAFLRLAIDLWASVLKLPLEMVAMQTTVAAQPDLNVHVEFDPECGRYIAWCDDIGLATEADSYEEIVATCRDIGPWIARDNGFNISPDDLVFPIHQCLQAA